MVVAWNYWKTVLFLLWYVTLLCFFRILECFPREFQQPKLCKCWLVAVWPDICTWWIWEKWIKSWRSHWNTDFLRRSAQFSEASIHKFPKPFTYNLPLPHSKYKLSGVGCTWFAEWWIRVLICKPFGRDFFLTPFVSCVLLVVPGRSP